MNKQIRNDIILIAAVILIAAIGFTLYFLLKKEGNTVVVEINGERYGEYPLSEDISLDISNERGLNRMVISGGLVSVTSADCPDLICAKHPPISHEGETIVCLPHKLVIAIE